MAPENRPDDPQLAFTPPPASRRSLLPWVIAGVAICAGLGLLILFGGHHSTVPEGTKPGLSTPDPYASSLVISGLKMSEASNFAGGKVTYLDGIIANQGNKVLTGIVVQVAFRNDLNEIAQKETTPLSLIRTHEPYVDTQSVSAAPVKPGEQREFRLIFDAIPSDWNQQFPEIRIVQVSAK